MQNLNVKTITINCCRLALIVTLICIGIQYSIDLPNDFSSSDLWLILYFCGSYIASEFVARKLPTGGAPGAVFMIGILFLSGVRLYLSVQFTWYVVWDSQQSEPPHESMTGLIVVFELWIIYFQLAFTALFAGYALFASVKGRVESREDHRV